MDGVCLLKLLLLVLEIFVLYLKLYLFEELTKLLVCPKVRSLWSAIDDMLSTTKEDQDAVGSVLKGDVDQYVLDGTDRALKIPRSLLQRIEQLPHQVRINIILCLIISMYSFTCISL